VALAAVVVGILLLVFIGGVIIPLASLVASSVFVIGRGGVNMYITSVEYSSSVGNGSIAEKE
jgi:hypothetical protein